MLPALSRSVCGLILGIILCSQASADVVTVNDAASLRTALNKLTDGTVLRIAPGVYPGGFAVRGIANLTVEGTDAQNPPHFQGGHYAWHFSQCSGLKLRHLQASGQLRNGFNLDDGGQANLLTSDISLEHIAVRDIGPRGNCDGIKCSGLKRLTVRNCVVEGWAGQAIDLVGCHDVVIRECQFSGKAGYAQASGVQCKGGSRDVVIEKCQFTNAGERPINAGGSTGLAYFRPLGAKYEAQRVSIRQNTITGSLCSCAFTGIDGGEFVGNTILYPEKWVFRILQETTEPGFAPSRNVLIENNAIVFRRQQVSVEINIGPHTSPESFRFRGNRWFAEDRPERSRPNLPTPETNGTYGVDPRPSK